MQDKPRYADDYGAEDLDLVRSALLTVATRIGDLIDETVIIGGLVPPLSC